MVDDMKNTTSEFDEYQQLGTARARRGVGRRHRTEENTKKPIRS